MHKRAAGSAPSILGHLQTSLIIFDHRWCIVLANAKSQKLNDGVFEGFEMQALRKSTKPVIPPRGRDAVRARPALGSHQKQVDEAFARTFERYERTFEELAER